MSLPIIDRFWIQFLTDVFILTSNNKHSSGAHLWKIIVDEIIDFQYQDDSIPIHPRESSTTIPPLSSIVVSTLSLVKLIFRLLAAATTPKSSNPASLLSASVPNVDSKTTRPDGKSLSVPPLPATTMLHILNSKKLLVRLASRLEAEERLTTSTLECFETSLVSLLSEKLSITKLGTPSGDFDLHLPAQTHQLTHNTTLCTSEDVLIPTATKSHPSIATTVSAVAGFSVAGWTSPSTIFPTLAFPRTGITAQPIASAQEPKKAITDAGNISSEAEDILDNHLNRDFEFETQRYVGNYSDTYRLNEDERAGPKALQLVSIGVCSDQDGNEFDGTVCRPT